MSSKESSTKPTAAEVTSSSAPKSDPAAEDVADTLAPESNLFIYFSAFLLENKR